MSKQIIDVSVTMNDAREKCRFTIEIPYHLMKNKNFLEAMESLRLTDPVSWLKALADQIEAITEGEKNG